MLPGLELMGCTGLAVPAEVMQHVVRIESSWNPYAIGVVGGRLARQPRTLGEALSTARMLEQQGYNFSIGLAQVNRHNLAAYGLDSHEHAFDICPNLRAGARILAECYTRADQDWGKALSCYYSGNFVTGFRHGYVQKVLASWRAVAPPDATRGSSAVEAIPLAARSEPAGRATASPPGPAASIMLRRVQDAAQGSGRARAGVTGRSAAAVEATSGNTVPASGMPAAVDRQTASSSPTAADAPVQVQRFAAPAPTAAAAQAPRTGPGDGSPPDRVDAAFVF